MPCIRSRFVKTVFWYTIQISLNMFGYIYFITVKVGKIIAKANFFFSSLVIDFHLHFNVIFKALYEILNSNAMVSRYFYILTYLMSEVAHNGFLISFF